MAYTIKIHDSEAFAESIRKSLTDKITADGRFKCELSRLTFVFKGRNKKAGYSFTVRKIRLTQKKPYCGQHPGPCLVNPLVGPTKKPNATYLEWDDWVEFNNLVNDLLDEQDADADVWSKPMETKGIMWMRKGKNRRIKYDYDEEYNNTWSQKTGLPVMVWNLGTPDQFEKN